MYRTLNPGAIDVSVPFEEGARLAARYGFAGLAIDPSFLLEHGPDAVLEILQQHSLRPGSFGLPVDFRGSDEGFEASLGTLEPLAKAAQAVGCTRASTYIFSWSDELDFAANFAFHRERLAPPAAILADHGISLGLEFLGPKTLRDGHPHEFVYTVAGMLELGEAIGPNVGLLLDAWHWYTGTNDAADLDLLTKENVVDVHVNDAPVGLPRDEQLDNVRCLPGETGVIDIHTFLGRLGRIGYDGPVVVEPFNAPLRAMVPEDAVRTTAEALQRVWQGAGLE